MATNEAPSTSPMLLCQLRSLENQAAWERFVGLYQPLIMNLCRRAGLQAADIDDVTARVFAGLVAVLPEFSYDPAKRFRGYLSSAVQNALRSFHRERQRRPGDIASADPAHAATFEELPDPVSYSELAEELDDRMRSDLARLQEVIDRVRARVDETTWRAYWRTAIDKEPAVTVAAALGKSVAAVYMAKSRVSQMLRLEATTE